MDVQISSNAGNLLQFRLGANGNIWCGQSAMGGTVATSVSVAAGSTALTVAAPTIIPNMAFGVKYGLPNIYSEAGLFTALMADKFMVLPTGSQSGQVYQPQRHYVSNFVANTDILTRERQTNWRTYNQTYNVTWGGAHFIPADSSSTPDIVLFYPDGTIFNTQVAYGGYISSTQVTLANPAPQALVGQSIPVFLGRMGIKWFDTGIVAANIQSGDLFEIDVNRSRMELLYKSAYASNLSQLPIAQRFVERFGGPFRPVFRPVAANTIRLSSLFIDDPNRTKIQPAATPWELRGAYSPAQNWYHGGVGGHPSSDLRTYVTDLVFDVNDLCTS
jgi:hypothetical protein